MTPGARIQAVIDILEKMEDSRVPLDTVCGDYFRHRRYIGSKDRAFIAETIYILTRATARLGWWMQKHDQEDTPRNRIVTYLGLQERDLKWAFEGGKYAPDPLTPSERAYADKLPVSEDFTSPDMPIDVQVECPTEHVEKLQTAFGDNFEEEMKAMLVTAPLDIRVNVTMADREKVHKSLETESVETDETKFSPWGLRARNKTYLSRTRAFTKGWIDIQDEGSQLIALACNAKQGMHVLDYCAGAGGKTIALANAMNIKGRIIAMDIDARRLEKSRPRFRRAYVHDIIETRALTEDKNRKWLKRQKGTFDVVLTDVPCSGSGTWRRNPDMRWTTYGPSLEEILAMQTDILERTAKCVKEGGRLVYATCSLFKEENEDQIERFLKDHPEFELLPISKAWPQDLPVPCEGDVMRLTPHQHKTDGFFAAVLVRK